MEPIRVHIADFVNAPLKDNERGTAGMFSRELVQYANGQAIPTDDPGQADLVILLESSFAKQPSYVKNLLAEPLLKQYWGKLFTINYEDNPAGSLPGLYTSICPPFYRPKLHRSWPALGIPCVQIYAVTDAQIQDTDRQYLYSFLGSKSHPVRREILNLYAGVAAAEGRVIDVDRWFNHSEQEKDDYVKMSLQSKFVLCPRGYAPFTYRICETMALGRVPVVIADDWVPFAFEDTEPYYVRIAENEIHKIPVILRELEGQAETIGANARRLWKKYSAPETRIVTAVNALRTLQKENSGFKSYEEWAAHWRDPKTAELMGWTLPQRIRREVKSKFIIAGRKLGLNKLKNLLRKPRS